MLRTSIRMQVSCCPTSTHCNYSRTINLLSLRSPWCNHKRTLIGSCWQSSENKKQTLMNGKLLIGHKLYNDYQGEADSTMNVHWIISAGDLFQLPARWSFDWQSRYSGRVYIHRTAAQDPVSVAIDDQCRNVSGGVCSADKSSTTHGGASRGAKFEFAFEYSRVRHRLIFIQFRTHCLSLKLLPAMFWTTQARQWSKSKMAKAMLIIQHSLDYLPWRLVKCRVSAEPASFYYYFLND